jgi:hypothetical protein
VDVAFTANYSFSALCNKTSTETRLKGHPRQAKGMSPFLHPRFQKKWEMRTSASPFTIKLEAGIDWGVFLITVFKSKKKVGLMTPLRLDNVHGSPRTTGPCTRRMREMLLHNKDEKGGDRGLIKKMRREEREWRRLPGGGHQIHVLLTKC